MSRMGVGRGLEGLAGNLRIHDHSGSGQGGDSITNAVGVSTSILTAGYFDMQSVGGTYAKLGSITQLGGGFEFFDTALIQPVISANQNNWNPTNFGTSSIILLDCNGAGRTITGFSTASFSNENKSFWIYPFNMGGGSLTLANASASSTSGNRLACPNSANYLVGANESVFIQYLPDLSAANPFRVFGQPQSSGTLPDHTHNVTGDGGDTITATVVQAAGINGLTELTASGAFELAGVITPTIAASVNNWSPANLAVASMIIVDCSAGGRTITGFDAGQMQVEGQTFWLGGVNVGGGNITLAHGSASSTSGNRIACPGGVNYVMFGPNMVQIIYSPTMGAANSFRVVGPVV